MKDSAVVARENVKVNAFDNASVSSERSAEVTLNDSSRNTSIKSKGMPAKPKPPSRLEQIMKNNQGAKQKAPEKPSKRVRGISNER